MGLFRSNSAKTNINQALAEREPDSILLDVREKKEYARGHIPGSVNLPATMMSLAYTVIPTKTTPVYVYCLSGARSVRATTSLQKMGYSKVKNIGGLNKYKGPIEK